MTVFGTKPTNSALQRFRLLSGALPTYFRPSFRQGSRAQAAPCRGAQELCRPCAGPSERRRSLRSIQRPGRRV